MANKEQNIAMLEAMLEKNISKDLPENVFTLNALKLNNKPFQFQSRVSAGNIKVQPPEKITLLDRDATTDVHSGGLLEESKSTSQFEKTQLETDKDIPRSQKNSRQRRDQDRRCENVKKRKQFSRSSALQ